MPFLVAPALLVFIGFPYFVAPLVFEVPCPEPEEEGDGLGSSSPAPSPAAGCVCLRVSCAVVRAANFVVGVLHGITCGLCYIWFADAGEDEADGVANKAGYDTIDGDLEVALAGTGADGN